MNLHGLLPLPARHLLITVSNHMCMSEAGDPP